MKTIKKLLILMLIFLAITFLNNKSHADSKYTNLTDEIVNYDITIDPRMNDGSLDIIYEITWKVLDSTTEGPLTWVLIGTPNDGFKNPTALSDNIRQIQQYDGSYVRIDFKKSYKAGEQLTFKYRINQSYMYKISWGHCKYEFTPAWFTNAEIDNLTIKWNADQAKSNNAKTKQDNYLIWNKKNLKVGEKITAKVKYKKSAFSELNKYSQRKTTVNNTQQNSTFSLSFVIFILIFTIPIIFSILDCGYGGGYYRHRGFWRLWILSLSLLWWFWRSLFRRWTALAVAEVGSTGGGSHGSCACACAGSGRAGCSRKDFYGTNLNSKKLRKL